MFVKNNCKHCKSRIEFDNSHAGDLAECPHCGLQTILALPPPPVPDPHYDVWAKIGVGVLICLAAAYGFDWHFEKVDRQQQEELDRNAKGLGHMRESMATANAEAKDAAEDFDRWLKHLTNNP